VEVRVAACGAAVRRLLRFEWGRCVAFSPCHSLQPSVALDLLVSTPLTSIL
jgi:hypothetical protein